MRYKIILSFAAGLLLSVAGFYFAFRRVPLELLAESLGSVNYLWLIPGGAVGLLSFAVRALRWKSILSSILKLRFFSAFHPLMIGFMINSVLPGRIGELARPAIIKKQDGVPFALGLTTIAAERFLDGITLILLFALVLANVHIAPDLQIEFRGWHLDRETLENLSRALIRVCIFVSMAVAAISIPAVQRFLKHIILKAPFLFFASGSRTGEKVFEKCCLPLTRILDNIAAGLSMVKQPANLLVCLFYSFVIWLLQAIALYILALGFSGLSLGFGEMTAVFIIICFFIMLPSVPGYWGLWEAGAVFAMALFGVAANSAAGFALLSHLMLMIPVLFVGIFSTVITGVNIFRVSYEGVRKSRRSEV